MDGGEMGVEVAVVVVDDEEVKELERGWFEDAFVSIMLFFQ